MGNGTSIERGVLGYLEDRYFDFDSSDGDGSSSSREEEVGLIDEFFDSAKLLGLARSAIGQFGSILGNLMMVMLLLVFMLAELQALPAKMAAMRSEGAEDVLSVPAGKRHHGVGGIDTLGQQHLWVSRITADDQDSRK